MNFYVVWFVLISTGVCRMLAATEEANGDILALIKDLEESVSHVRKELREDMVKVKEEVHQVRGDLGEEILAVKKQVDENEKKMREIGERISAVDKGRGMVLVDAPTKIAATLLRTVCIGKTYKIAFQILPTSWASSSRTWASIINFRGNVTHMNRVLIVWLHDKRMYFSTDTVNGHYDFQSSKVSNLDEWLSVEITNTREGANYIYTLKINGKKELSITNIKPRRFCDIKAYLASPPNAAPWPAWPAQPGYVRRFTFYSEETQ